RRRHTRFSRDWSQTCALPIYEKIDIVDWSDDLTTFVATALSPAKVTSAFIVDESLKAVRALVPDYQLSLAIGKEGQNARLAAKLTGARIDIQPDSIMES